MKNDGACGRVNYCSKQKEKSYQLCPEIDTAGSRINGNSTFRAGDDSETRWRYATPEEAAEYERVGKPFDVTKMSKEPVEQLLTIIL